MAPETLERYLKVIPFFIEQELGIFYKATSSHVSEWNSVFQQSVDTPMPPNSESNRKTSKPMCFLPYNDVSLWKNNFYCLAAFYQKGFFWEGIH